MRRYTYLATLALIMGTLGSCQKKVEYACSYSEVKKQDITTSVTATGTIEPVTSVDVGTQVSGIVSKLYVDYNSVVKAGQVIAELDRTNLMSDLNSAKANLTSQESNLAYQKANYERYKTLHEKGLISANEYEQAHLSYVQAQQQVQTQRQSVKRAETNLGYATITSPIDGVVLSKEVEEGQTVASSFNTPTLFKIARDLTDMRVIADVDEADIGEVKEGQRVSFTVDAFPDDVFEGRVTQVRQQATTTSNVVTYEVVISAPNQELKLKPGLTASVTIYTIEMNGVLAIANKALRFTPTETLLNEGETITDCDAPQKLWVKEGKAYKAIPVQTGMTNGALTQVMGGAQEGLQVVSDISDPTEGIVEEKPNNPFMPNHGGNNKDKKK
ncbi:MAG: efflux RND transporter periplasmic adaptor subunit [Bacteroidaceae bacterium]|nr:efflux RND transporter periplasmic adaptor subunit [Bacteroidaceae bacterium]